MKKPHPQKELDVLEYWDEQKCFETSVEMRPEGDPYVFYDGPPFATGLPHYGHIVASVMKDVVPRFWTMRGHRVERKWGWDCHGLPIENIVEKKFNLNSKDEIEEMGVDVFNDRCHAEVMKYAEDWKKVIRRLGRWVDMENDYKTMDFDFMESVWWVFKQLWDKEMIYEGSKSMHICPRCETVLSKTEVAQEYDDITDISVFVTMPILDGDYKGMNLLAWTTTPWTLPGNMLAAIHTEMEYSVVESEGEKYILLKDRIEDVFKDKEFTVGASLKGADLIGAKYEPLFPFFQQEGLFRIVAGDDFVTAEDGTGVVHIASGFGEDDKLVGEREGLDPILHIKMNGVFIDEVALPLSEEGYDVKNKPVKAKGDTQSIDIEMVKALAHKGRLFAKKKIVHSYPHCWRCDTPLINYSTKSWFVSVSKIIEKLETGASGIHWVPGNIKEGRFGKGLSVSPDWAISRSRYWGTPMPIWRSEDGEVLVIGSAAELEELSGKKLDNLHKQYVDGVEIEKDGKVFKRIPEVLDCWFESGSMPYAQLHYPFENKEKFDHGFPAAFIAEGVDQTRLWFHKLHVIAMILFDMPAYKNVIVNGIVLAEDGKKMSKRLRNYPDPMEVMEKYGSDAVRYYLMSSPVVRAENLRFAEKEVAEVSKKFINIMQNVLAFYELYAEHDDNRAPSGEHVLDKWILSRMNETLKEETEAMEAYDLQTASRGLQGFVTDLSTWYIRRSRDRMKSLATGEKSEDALEALATLREVLETFSKMIAPFMPFLAEMIYQSVNGGFKAHDGRVSVHHENWPEISSVNEEVVETMGLVRALVSRGLDIREEAGRPIKQVLAAMTVMVPGEKLADEYLELIKEEVNVRAVAVESGEKDVSLDLELTLDLIREGMAREVVRRVNGLRKDVGMTIQDKVNLKIWSESGEVEKMLEEYKDRIQEGVLAEEIVFEKDESLKQVKEFRVAEQDIWIGF